MASRLAGHSNSYARNPAVEAAKLATLAKTRAQQVQTGPAKGLPPGPSVHFGNTVGGAAQGPTPMPWDATYESNVDTINKNRDTDYAAIDNQVAAAKQAYGFDDTTNPFSKIALLRQAFANQQAGIDTGATSRGQLFSGSRVDDQAQATHQNDINTDTLRRDYDATLNDLANRRSQIGHNADDAAAAANWQRVQTATQAGPDTSTVTAPAATPPAFKAQAGTDSKGNPGTWHIYPDGRKPVFVKGR